ncbi:hypothetical protein PENSPDRAFT_280333 [Peniophora sp. CONT]|nr:hypothetical protein PENSPDRAFT_280333 [Peniophora sp. CONT]
MTEARAPISAVPLLPTASTDTRDGRSAHSASPRPDIHSRHSPSPGRSYTDPDPSHLKIKKRIVVCCDGTWQDGLSVKARWQYTNILRLARAVNHVDERFMPPKPQVVFYQSGLASTESFDFMSILEGATAAGLGDKVQEAYGFIAHNYEPGDEIFLFGFSRGAYTARMVAWMIEVIGVLDRTDMDHFAGIFMAFLKHGKTDDPKEKDLLSTQVKFWTQSDSPGKQRANYDDSSFAIKCVGVFDTVGSIGMPDELKFGGNDDKMRTLFGFPDSTLGSHVERAYQALAIEETRSDFVCNKWTQTELGRRKKQILHQCWFTGSHADIGGGFQEHDLSDLTLFWMAAQVGDILSLDVKYLLRGLGPTAPWGAQKYHDPRTGIYSLTIATHRTLPTQPNPQTHELIHSSVLQQKNLPEGLKETVDKHPELVAKLLPLEEELKVNWPYDPSKVQPAVAEQINSKPSNGGVSATSAATTTSERRKSFFAKAKDTLTRKGGRSATGDMPAPTVSTEIDKGSPSKDSDAQGTVNHFESFSAFGSYVIEYLKSG